MEKNEMQEVKLVSLDEKEKEIEKLKKQLKMARGNHVDRN